MQDKESVASEGKELACSYTWRTFVFFRSSLTLDTKDEIYNVLTALETKFDLEENF